MTFAPLAQIATPILNNAIRPREHRDEQRANWTGEAVKRDGGNAMDVALAKVGAIALNNPACIANNLKLRVQQVIERGATDYGVRSRYYGRARKFQGFTITEAIWAVDYWLKEEQRKFDNAIKLGAASRLPIMVLTELRLILRLARFRGWDFKFWVDALVDGQQMHAAE